MRGRRLLVRRGNDIGGHHHQLTAIAVGTLVRIAAIGALVLTWCFLMAVFLSNAYTDPLRAYWDSLSPSQQEVNCDTWAQYPRYTQNTLVGVVNFKVTNTEAHDFLWKECTDG